MAEGIILCGIVFLGGSNLLETHVSFFDSLLHADVVRGKHSTGVFRGVEGGGTDLYKEAVPGPAYLELKGYKKLRGENTTQYQRDRLVKEGKDVPNPLSNFYVGHNRYATQGAINGKNAHPFKHGNITLVHNGTLRGQHRLPDSKDFEVDSENICHSINKIGIDETVQKLQGAFTLVWHNREDQTLNFIRNHERPFYMIEATNGLWAGASEKEMIHWLNNRRKGKLVIKNEFEIVSGTQYVFDVSNGGFKLKEERKHTLPTFPYTYPQGRSSAWWEDDDYYLTGRYGTNSQNGQKSQTKATPQSQKGSIAADANTDKVNEILASSGINTAFRKDKKVQFWPYEFREYIQSDSNHGSIRGWSMDTNQVYIEVELHAMSRKDFDDIPSNTLCETTIVSSYFERTQSDGSEVSTAVAIGRGLSLYQGEDTIEDIVLDEITLAELGEDIPPFDISETDLCEICDKPLEEGDVFVLEDDHHGTQIFCGSCNRHYGLRGTELSTLITEKEAEIVEPTVDNPMSLAALALEDTSSESKEVAVVATPKEEGGDSTEDPKKTLLNGWAVTKSRWESELGFCGFCNESISWDEAETTNLLYQTQPCCDKHYQMLMGN